MWFEEAMNYCTILIAILFEKHLEIFLISLSRGLPFLPSLQIRHLLIEINVSLLHSLFESENLDYSVILITLRSCKVVTFVFEVIFLCFCMREGEELLRARGQRFHCRFQREI